MQWVIIILGIFKDGRTQFWCLSMNFPTFPVRLAHAAMWNKHDRHSCAKTSHAVEGPYM